MTDSVTYFQCKYCKGVFILPNDRFTVGGDRVPPEEAVAVVLAGMIDHRFDACVACTFDSSLQHQGDDHYPSVHGARLCTRYAL